MSYNAVSSAHHDRQECLEAVMEVGYGGDPHTDGDSDPAWRDPRLAICELESDLERHN